MATILSSKEFSLKWNNFCNNLTTGFFSHLSENDLVDVTIAVEGQLLAAHKLVLSVCSPYFKNIFKRNPCQHPVIILKDVKHREVEALLKFMYQGEVNVRQEDLPTFLRVAQMLQIKGLEGSEGQIMPLLNDYVNASETQSNSEYAANLSEAKSMQDNRKKTSDESVHSERMIKRSIKKRKKHVIEDDSSIIEEIGSEANINNENEVCLMVDHRKNIDNSGNENTTHNIEDNDDVNDNQEVIELINEQNAKQNSMQPVVEPVTYRLSARGRPQLIYEGYVYNLTSRSEGLNRSHYRCTEQHRGCRGKCSVIAERFMPTGVRDHNHPPGYQSKYDYKKKKSLDVDSA